MCKTGSQTEGRLWSEFGEILVELWPDIDQILVRLRANAPLGVSYVCRLSQNKVCSIFGQTLAGLWSDFDQTSGRMCSAVISEQRPNAIVRLDLKPMQHFRIHFGSSRCQGL